MAQTITLTAAHLQTLDLSPARSLLESLEDLPGLLGGPDLGLRFDIQLDRDPSDPRELSEIPEVRLWFIRLDGHYPWLPLVLDWEAGELARYAAMLVPHQFSPSEGIRYNPEALEIFIMQKIFVISAWLQGQGQGTTGKLKLMAKMLGYDIEEGLFELLR